MTDTSFVERRHCNQHDTEHYRSCMNADAIKGIETDCKENREKIYASLSQKTPLWTFLPLIAVMLSILGLVWKINLDLGTIQSKMSILEYRYESLFEHKLERK